MPRLVESLVHPGIFGRSVDDSSTGNQSPDSRCLNHEECLLPELQLTVHEHEDTFHYSGTILIAHDKVHLNHITVDSGLFASPPAVLRQDLSDGEATSKVAFPPGEDPDDKLALQELLGDCAPVTFGHRGEDVLDESHWEAVQLDSGRFLTNFSPHVSQSTASQQKHLHSR